jgi:hypothetical protein
MHVGRRQEVKYFPRVIYSVDFSCFDNLGFELQYQKAYPHQPS